MQPQSTHDTFFGHPLFTWRDGPLFATAQRMVRHLAAFLLLAACAHRPPVSQPSAVTWPQPSSPKLDQAEQAMFNSEYSSARTLLGEVIASDAKRENRDRAARRLANIQWRIDGDAPAARRTLASITVGGPEQMSALLELARMERMQGDFAASRTAASRAIHSAHDTTEKRNATVSLARAIVEPEKLRVLGGGKLHDRREVARALAMLRQAVKDDPGRLTTARALLETASLLVDRTAIREAWHSYFLTVGPSTILDPVRPAIDGTDSDRMALARALATSGFHDNAAILAPEWSEIVRYARYTREAQNLTNEYYRRIALADGIVAPVLREAYERDLRALTEGVWRELIGGTGGTYVESVLHDNADTELGRRFGLYATSGETGGRLDLHAGHRVVDDARQIEQYGRQAKIRFIGLDSMISNGYESWARDGRAEHGGWGDTGLIVQVRSAYAGGPLAAWSHLTDPADRARGDEEIARETPADDTRATENPYAYLPGLHARLARQAAQGLYETLESQGLAADALRNRWLTEYARRELESSIFAHEGRHAIDAQYAPELTPDAPELEYRAKLSEIAFAPDPRLALVGGIVTPDIGSSSPHGKANSRIMKVFVDWMESHRSQILGLDPQHPLLPQLDKLTDDQIRAAARSVDPWTTAPS